ncbi:unnamed protein product [Chondrus crispus]|uniref:Uncharacterized protein n=1 Tax=Chondrus crispus TaxID=2769 RepID=R7QNA9_CHOCR|nr:unnamed protein product [Chondrus crispus]CDF38956.1 unnamed protein product [Chondrus crispus]|eukprot:XP_005718861.1 unnamed protein product [Chondrus crispus]
MEPHGQTVKRLQYQFASYLPRTKAITSTMMLACADNADKVAKPLQEISLKSTSEWALTL